MPKMQGFALPAAVFLLVVLAGLAVWLTRSSQAIQAQSNLELEGARAYQAARAGLEAGIYQATHGGDCNRIAQTVTFPAGSELLRFTATVTCQSHSYDEGGQSLTLFTLTSVACNEPAAGVCPNPTPSLPEYAERHLRALVEG